MHCRIFKMPIESMSLYSRANDLIQVHLSSSDSDVAFILSPIRSTPTKNSHGTPMLMDEPWCLYNENE